MNSSILIGCFKTCDDNKPIRLLKPHLIPPPLDNERNVEAQAKGHRDGTHLDRAIGLDALKPTPVGPVAILAQDCSIENVQDEVAEDVGQQLFIDKFVDAALPPAQDLCEADEPAGVSHIGRVGHGHFCTSWSLVRSLARSFLNDLELNKRSFSARKTEK